MIPVPTVVQLKSVIDTYHAAHGRPPAVIMMTLPQWVRFRERLLEHARFADAQRSDLERRRAERRFKWPTVGEFYGVSIVIGGCEDLP